MQPSQPSFHKTNLISSLLIMSSFYSSLRFLSNEGCKSYRPLHPQSLTPLLFFLLRTSKSTKRAGEAVTLSTMCPHTHVSTPEYSRGITTYTLYYLSIHDVYPRFHPNAYPIVAYPCILILRYSLSHPTHHSDILIIVSSVPWLIQSQLSKVIIYDAGVSQTSIKTLTGGREGNELHKCRAKAWPYLYSPKSVVPKWPNDVR